MKTPLLPPAGVLAPVSVFFFPDGLMCQQHSSSKCVTQLLLISVLNGIMIYGQKTNLPLENDVLTLILVAFWTPLSTKLGLLGNTGDLNSSQNIRKHFLSNVKKKIFMASSPVGFLCPLLSNVNYDTGKIPASPPPLLSLSQDSRRYIELKLGAFICCQFRTKGFD